MTLRIPDRTRLAQISVSDILPDGSQPRKFFDEYELQLLCDSIKENGIIQPLSVRPQGGKYILIAGERRLRAAVAAGLKKVPCIIHRTDEMTAAYYSIIENLQRCDLTVFEEAEGINRLVKECGLPYNEVAAKLGIAESTLSNKLRILRLSDSIRNRITAAGLTERHARALLRLPGDARDSALDKIIGEGLTLRESEKYIESLLVNKEDSPPDTPRRKTAVGDLRIFTNSLTRLVDTMTSSGVTAALERSDNKEFIEYRIKIRREELRKERPTQLRMALR